MSEKKEATKPDLSVQEILKRVAGKKVSKLHDEHEAALPKAFKDGEGIKMVPQDDRPMED